MQKLQLFGTVKLGNNMASVVAPENWESILNLGSRDQIRYLSERLGEREPILKFADIKKGDHLVRKGSTAGRNQYEHHFICIGSEKERPTIVHYYNTLSDASSPTSPATSWPKITTSCVSSGTALGSVAIIQEITLPHEDFIKNEGELQAKGKEVARVVWPKKLRRYSVEEVIENAQKRKGEKSYDLLRFDLIKVVNY